jgi:hypothetical protein
MTSSQSPGQEPSLTTLAQMRARTDIAIPTLWMVLPLASYLLWTVVAVAWWSAGAGLGTGELTLVISGVGISGFAVSAAASYVLFRLINRANEHAERARALLLNALNSLEIRAVASDPQALLPLNSAEEGLYKLVRSERERSAILWALLFLIPYAGWIFLGVAQWRLSREFAKHSRLESNVLEDVDRTLRRLGTQGIPIRYAPVSLHNNLGIVVVLISVIELLSAFALGVTGALILVYLTIGAFSLYWIDLSIRDPTAHFHYHSQLEEDILRELPDAVNTNARVA